MFWHTPCSRGMRLLRQRRQLRQKAKNYLGGCMSPEPSPSCFLHGFGFVLTGGWAEIFGSPDDFEKPPDS